MNLNRRKKTRKNNIATLQREKRQWLANIAQLGAPLLFRLCPQCIGEDQLLRRRAILPHIRCCPVHRLTLIEMWECDVALQPFASHTQPVTCGAGGWAWASLPAQ